MLSICHHTQKKGDAKKAKVASAESRRVGSSVTVNNCLQAYKVFVKQRRRQKQSTKVLIPLLSANRGESTLPGEKTGFD